MVIIMVIPVGVSARHVHLNEETFKKLFGKDDLTKFKDINQPGLYAAEETVTIKTLKGEFNNVRILGPLRDYNQVEISKTDAYVLGINPPVRNSGNFDSAASVTVVGPCGEVTVDAVIIAERHIHMSEEQAKELNLSNGQSVVVKIGGIKPGTIIAKIKTSKEAYLELHLDLDDANGFLLKQDDKVDVEI